MNFSRFFIDRPIFAIVIATFITLVLAGPWMITIMTDFIRRLFESIPSMIG